MAEALAHGADVHAASEEEEGKTPLIQAVMGVRHCLFSLRLDVNQQWFRLKYYTFYLISVQVKISHHYGEGLRQISCRRCHMQIL